MQVNMREHCAEVDKEANIEMQDVVASCAMENCKTMGNKDKDLYTMSTIRER
jgi:hypothetical protein